MRKPYRLGLDIGTNSIGWWVLFLDKRGEPSETGIGGVRIFSEGRDPKSKATLASDRRLARQMRRRRDRFLRRRKALLRELTAAGLMPADPAAAKVLEALDPLRLRAEGLDRPLTLHELGRALFHINQRRGFKSNRKTADNEDGVIKQGIEALEFDMARAGARTLGEYLHKRVLAGESARARPVPMADNRTKNEYAFYPSRALMEAEFDRLWRVQAAHHPDVLTDALRDKLHRIIFFQRPLKPVDPGKCTFIDGEKRAPQAHPLFQRYRLLTELANLRLIDSDLSERPLTPVERDLLLRFATGEGKDLKPKKALTFDRMRRLLKLDADTRFSLEDSGRKDLQGDLTGAAMIRTGGIDPLRWHKMSAEDRAALVDHLLFTEQTEDLLAWLTGHLGLDEQTAQFLADKPGLPKSFGRLSEKALAKLVPILERETRIDEATGHERPIMYHEACEVAGWHHSDQRTGEIFDTLPYYGALLSRETVDAPKTVEPEAQRYGWVGNPTVHIGLNQLRLLINQLIKRYGHPQEISIEIMRDLKLNKEKRDRINKQNRENRANRERWKKLLADELGIDDPGPRDMMKMRLFEEMPATRRRCVFSGEAISLRRLFSDDIEIEHIIPFSRSLDDGFMNKVLATRAANRQKGNKTPYEAFGHTADWADILARADDLHPQKRKRFSPDFPAEPKDFLQRHLNDGAYLSRLAKRYLSGICHPDRIWVTPGRLTGLLRGKWGLNDPLGGGNVKTRVDHRHHANDAFVVACTSRSVLNRLSRAAGLAEEQHLEALVDGMPPPFPRFDREDYIAALRRIIVSHRPDHSYRGKMHNDTALGLTGAADGRGVPEVVHRKPLSAITKPTDLDAVRDPDLRDRLKALTAGKTGADFAGALGQATDSQGKRIRSVRMVENLKVIGIRDDRGAFYKGYKGDSNWCFEIIADAKGKWTGRIVSTFHAYQRAREGTLAPEPDVIMRLFKEDLLCIDDPADPGTPRYLRVVKFSGNQIVTADHFEGGNLKARDADPDDPFKYTSRAPEWYRRHNARRAGLDPLGRPSTKWRRR